MVRFLRFVGGALAACTTSFSSASAAPEQQQPRVDIVEDVAATRWLKLQTIGYTDQTGAQRKWDVASRTTKDQAAEADAVCVQCPCRIQRTVS